MSKSQESFVRSPWFVLSAGAVIGAVVAVTSIKLMDSGQATVIIQPPSAAQLSQAQAQQAKLHAFGASSADTVMLATGPTDDSTEGCFALDSVTGTLTMVAPNARTAQFSNVFKGNVLNDLGVQRGKAPKFVMVTGQASFVRGAGVNQPGRTVVYIADANSGNMVAYGFQWNQNAQKAGAPQAGTFMKLGQFKVREAILDN